MLILRPIEPSDLEDLIALAAQLDSVNLPRDPDFLAERIASSQRAFRQDLGAGEWGTYVFVLEDTEAGRCIGSSTILGKTGVPGAPYFWFEVSSEERRSVELDLRFTLGHRHSMTLSAGFAAGFREGDKVDDEIMISLKIL